MNEIAKAQIDIIRQRCEVIKPLVVIECTAYNHEPYIRDALDGFIMQKTDFPFVVIVHDDASTDKTVEIIKKYAAKYPNIILPIYEKENQYSKKNGCLGPILRSALHDTGAKYIAICEGDDYWIDTYKLQKQINFLESHPNIIYTCHRYKEQYNNKPDLTIASNPYLDKFTSAEGFEFDLQYVFKTDWVAKTLTSVYRAECLYFDELRGCPYYRDIHNIYQILSRGNGYCFQFVGGVYRKQETGTWSQSDQLKKAYIEVKTWESIYDKIPSKFNLWKIRNHYANYMIQALKKRKLFKVQNFIEFKSIFYSPIEFFKSITKIKKRNELRRIKTVGLNREDTTK